MDSLPREIFNDTVQNDSVIKLIEMCDIVHEDDLIMLDNAVISRIEDYITQCLLIKYPDVCNQLFKEYDAVTCENFRFKPVDVIRLMRASNKLKCVLNQGKSGSISNNNSEEEANNYPEETFSETNSRKRFNNSFLDNCLPTKTPRLIESFLPQGQGKTETFLNLALKSQLQDPNLSTTFLQTLQKSQQNNTNNIINNNLLHESLIDIKPQIILSQNNDQDNDDNGNNHNGTSLPALTNASSPSVISNEDELNRRSEIDNIAYRISNHAQTFFKVHLEHHKDFDVEFELSKDATGENRKSGIFLCYLCRSVKGGLSRIRFNITSKNYYVLSNVSTHLTKHYEKNGRRKSINIV